MVVEETSNIETLVKDGFDNTLGFDDKVADFVEPKEEVKGESEKGCGSLFEGEK